MAMSFSLDTSDQVGEQRQPLMGAPPLPPSPPPAQAYQQIQQQGLPQQYQHQLGVPQQMVSLPLAPPNNLQHMQHQPHMPLVSHPHLPRPPPPLGMHTPIQSSMAMPHPMANPMGIQGSANKNFPPMPQGHMIGMNPSMHSGGPVPSNIMQSGVGGFVNGMADMQGSLSARGQPYPLGGMFSTTQTGQLGPIPGLNTYQPGMGMGANMGHPAGLPGPPLPPPPQHGSAPQ